MTDSNKYFRICYTYFGTMHLSRLFFMFLYFKMKLIILHLDAILPQINCFVLENNNNNILCLFSLLGAYFSSFLFQDWENVALNTPVYFHMHCPKLIAQHEDAAELNFSAFSFSALRKKILDRQTDGYSVSWNIFLLHVKTTGIYKSSSFFRHN